MDIAIFDITLPTAVMVTGKEYDLTPAAHSYQHSRRYCTLLCEREISRLYVNAVVKPKN